MVAESTPVAKYLAEFIGTFLLIFTVGCNVLGKTDATWAGVSIAFVLMVSIYALGGISGGQLQPSSLSDPWAFPRPWEEKVSIGRLSASTPTVQCASLVFWLGVCYSLLFGQSFNLAPAKGFSWYHAGLCEVLYTFMLTFVVMNVAVAKKNAAEKGQYYGMAIAFTVIAGAYGAGAVSGGCFNPAVALGIDLSSAGVSALVGALSTLLSSCLALLWLQHLYKVVRPEDFLVEKSLLVTELVSEFLGTYMLVLTVGLNVLGKSKAAAFSIAASLTSMIYALGDVSGAHFNPAVTVAILASGRCTRPYTNARPVLFAAAQIAGGMAAAHDLRSFVYHGGASRLGTCLGRAHGLGVAIAESDVYISPLPRRSALSGGLQDQPSLLNMFGFAIGACVTVGGFAIGGISGGSLNPAVS